MKIWEEEIGFERQGWGIEKEEKIWNIGGGVGFGWL